MTPMQPPQRPGMPPQRPGMPPQRPGMLPAPQGGMPFQSPSTPPPTRANGIAGAFQGINPAKAGYDVGTAAIMANQQQPQTQANQQAFQQQMQQQLQQLQQGGGMPGQGGGMSFQQALQQQQAGMGGMPQSQALVNQQTMMRNGFSPEMANLRGAFDAQQQEAGRQFQQQLAAAPADQRQAMSESFMAQQRERDAQFRQQNPMFEQQANQLRQQSLAGQGGAMPGQLGGQGATVLNEQQFMQRYGGMQPQVQMPSDPAMQQQFMQRYGGQSGLNAQQANQYGNPYAAQLANQFGAQGSMGLQPQTQANLGGAAGSLQQSLNAARAVPAVAGMSAPPGQQVNMFGAGAPMPQQQAPAGANFGVGPFGPGMGVQGGVGTGMQGMSVGVPQAGMANQQRYTPR